MIDKLVEYIKLHALSMEQDMENIHAKYEAGGMYSNEDTYMEEYLAGAIAACYHILSTIDEFRKEQ